MTTTKAPAKPRFGTLNEHLVCSLCRGYLVDATTITECLHSFCRSCIVQYIQGSSFCPRCEVQLHKGSPLRSLKPDKGLQDIVFKLVPNLFHNEMQRRRVYYDAHPQYADQTTPEQRGDCLERFYSPDDSISLSLEYHDRRKGKGSKDDKPLPPKRYLKCPALFTVGLLKKFVRLKFDLPREIMIDVFQRRESLADEYTLLDIAYIYPWKRSEPMRFFYCLRDPRVPESDEEVEREMPSLCAAVTARATRASRRASSASSLASPLASPRGSPVPRVKTESPPPAKLTSQPPAGTPQPKPLTLAKPAPTSPPKACSPAGPKITLTISPSRGTVTSTTTELPPRPDSIAAPLKSPTSTTAPAPKPAATSTPKPATPAAATPVSVTPAPPSTTTPATTAVPTAATPSTATAAPAAPSAPSPKKTLTPVAAAAAKPAGTPSAPKNFPATITTRTPNGGFITVKNPIARPPNGMSVGAKMASPPPKSPGGPGGPGTPVGAAAPAAPKPVSSTPKAAPAAVATPKQGGVKTKRHSNGLPVLAPKDPKLSTTTLSPIVALQQMAHINKMAEAIKSPAVAASNARPSAPAVAPAKGPAPADDEKNKVETAKAILQLSMGFKRSDTPTDATFNNRIDNIVKGLQDDESNDGTLVIKSEPASPEPAAESASPRHSPVPPAVTIPKVNGLTITPIEPGKRKAPPGQAAGLDEKRIKVHDALPAAKRPGDAAHASPAPAKMAKVDKIADSIKQKQQEQQQRQQAAKRPPTPKPAAVKPAAASPVLGPAKPPVPAPSTFKTFPPAQIKPVMPQAAKPSPQHAAKPQPSLQPRPAAKPLPPLQPKPAVMAPLTPRPQHPAAPVAAQQHHLAKAGAAQQGGQTKPAAGQTNNHAKPGPPQQNAQAKPGSAQQNQPRPGAPQQGNPNRPGAAPQNGPAKPGAAQQNNQAKPAPGQQNAQPKSAGANPQGLAPGANQQPAKPAPMQPAKPANAQQPQNAATQPSKPAAVQPPKQSPNNQLNKKSPESPVKNKKPIPDLQRLQRPLSGTTVNGSLSLAEVKEQLAKKGHYSPPPQQQQQQQQPNRTPPRLIEISQQRKSAPPAPAAGHRDYGALDLTAASPRADHGGSWTPPANFAQSLAKRQQQLLPHVLRPPPSSLSSASPSPPADSPGPAATSVSPELFMDQNMMAQQVQAHALLQQIQLQSLLQAQAQAQASMQPRFPAGLKKAIEDWGVKATATAKRK